MPDRPNSTTAGAVGHGWAPGWAPGWAHEWVRGWAHEWVRGGTGAHRGARAGLVVRSAGPLALATMLALGGGCVIDDPRQGSPDTAAEADAAQGALRARTVAVTSARPLREGSAAAMSRTQAGVFFLIQDSGHEAVLHAQDVRGADRGAWRVTGATNNDWEALAMGPCGTPGNGASGCVYIGDTGDNERQRPSHTIYRLPEPTARRAGTTGSVRAERLDFRYPDQPHDVEAMWVGGDGTIWLVTKRPLQDRAGALRPALVFRLRATAWGGDTITALLADSLPIVPGSVPLRTITDAALSPDGRWVAVRTYTEVYVFATTGSDGRIDTSVAPTSCDVVSLGEEQGEGITWVDATTLLLTSEGVRQPIHLIQCDPPR
jgi:hypothetical protein